MYTTKRYEAHISVEEYLKKYVDPETFLESCKSCPNYNSIWSCPSYDFDVWDYWKKYTQLDLIAEKIIFDTAYAGKIFPPDKLEKLISDALSPVKQRLTSELMDREEEIPGSISLSAGSCLLCHGNCTRKEGQACRYPEKMRYSIESLGGNVGLTISRLMGIELEWVEENTLTHYFVLVCGLLH